MLEQSREESIKRTVLYFSQLKLYITSTVKGSTTKNIVVFGAD